jgi:hypothetical protein
MSIESKPLVPSLGCLLKTIEGLVKTADVVRTVSVNKTRWLLTADLLIESAMEKGILDV